MNFRDLLKEELTICQIHIDRLNLAIGRIERFYPLFKPRDCLLFGNLYLLILKRIFSKNKLDSLNLCLKKLQRILFSNIIRKQY